MGGERAGARHLCFSTYLEDTLLEKHDLCDESRHMKISVVVPRCSPGRPDSGLGQDLLRVAQAKNHFRKAEYATACTRGFMSVLAKGIKLQGFCHSATLARYNKG